MTNLYEYSRITDNNLDGFYQGPVKQRHEETYRRLGLELDKEHPLQVQALLDYDTKQYDVLAKNGVQSFNFDSLDPRFLNKINQTALRLGIEQPQRVPLSPLALSLLEKTSRDERADKANKQPLVPTVEVEQPLPEIDEGALGRQVLDKAFANEMLLLLQLDKYIKKHDLGKVDIYDDDVTEKVGEKVFDMSFTSAVNHLGQEDSMFQSL